MKVNRASALFSLLVATTGSGNALAQSTRSGVLHLPYSGAASQQPDPGQPVARQPRRARASLHLDVRQSKTWVGQALPVTVTAYFRDVDGVTLEGGLQINSKAVVTSNFTREPRQSTEIIDGEPTLVVTWTGTVTPSSPGPVDLTAELPVKIRYREAAPRTETRELDVPDPFADMDIGGIDSIFDQMRQRMQQQMQMFEQPLGRVQENATTLKATTRPLEALALPAADQPANFSGAVGQFKVAASVSSTHTRGSDPVTLRIVVEGSGDLDRVDIPGVATSDVWKAYPPTATVEPVTAGARSRRKVFEQVLLPLRDGDLTVPGVSLVAFDPVSAKYVTRETSPLVVSVEGPVSVAVSNAVASVSVATTASAPVAATAPTRLRRARDWLRRSVSGNAIVLEFGLVAALLAAIAAGLYRALRERRAEWALRRTMRRAAATGKVDAFLGSAHDLIEARLAEKWGVRPEEITPEAIRERLGETGGPLIEALSADEALRFAHGSMEKVDLRALCSSIERSLRGRTGTGRGLD